MSATITIRRIEGDLWRHEPNDQEQFFEGKYNAFISPSRFQVTSKSGRLMAFCPVSGVTVVDGSNSFNYSNFTALATKLYELEYPGVYVASSGGGSGSIYISEQTWSGSPLTVASGLSNIVVLNRNAFQELVSYEYSGTSLTLTSGVGTSDPVLILANQ